MTKEEEDEVHRLVQSVGVVQLSRVMFKDMDVSEMINIIILAGRGYSGSYSLGSSIIVKLCLFLSCFFMWLVW